MLHLGLSILHQPLPPVDVPVLQLQQPVKAVMPIDVSVLQQHELLPDVSILQQPVLPVWAAFGRVCPMAACAAFGHICLTAACLWTCPFYTSLSCVQQLL